MDSKYLVTLRYKLTIIFTLLVFVLSFILGSIFFYSKFKASESQDITTFSNIVSPLVNGNARLAPFVNSLDITRRVILRNRTVERFENTTFGTSNSLVNFLIINNEGNIVYQNIRDNIDAKVLESAFANIKKNQLLKLDDYYVIVTNIQDSRGNLYDVIGFKPRTYSNNDLTADLLRYTIIVLLFSIVFYLIGFDFAKRNIQPIEDNLKDMQNFIHNAGHELKTPIAILRGNLQILHEKLNKKDALVLEGITEVDRLNHLIDGLVELSDIRQAVHNENLDIQNEVNEVVEEFVKQAKKKKIELTVKGSSRYTVNANKDYFFILLSNIIKNAIKYTPEGGKVCVYIQKQKISIIDNGVGIESYNIDKIFDRFFQADRSRNNEGFGIGLSLVKKIADVYNWKISVKSRKRKGTTFILEF